MSDQRLKAAMEEIKQVLERHDVTAIVVLGDRDNMEHFTKVHASWTCMSYDGEKVSFKASRDEFPSAEAQKECLELSFGVVAGFSDACRHLQEKLDEILKYLSERFQIFHRTRQL